MKKFNILVVVLSLCSVLFLSDFKVFQTLFFVPNIVWVVPFYFLFLGSVLYFKKAFQPKSTLAFRFLLIFSHVILSIGFLYAGFMIWQLNSGNIFTQEVKEFQINLKNLWFWCTYQSYLILFFFSAFKQLVTIK